MKWEEWSAETNHWIADDDKGNHLSAWQPARPFARWSVMFAIGGYVSGKSVDVKRAKEEAEAAANHEHDWDASIMKCRFCGVGRITAQLAKAK